MNKPIQDGVGQRGFSDPLVPLLPGDPECDDGGVDGVAVLQDLEQILVTGQADGVSLAREMPREPFWPLHAARRLGQEVPWPEQV